MKKPIKTTDAAKVCSKEVTMQDSKFCTNVGDIEYTIFASLKKLQGEEAVFFNATEVVKQYNKYNDTKKRLTRWTESKRFKEIVEIARTSLGTTVSKLYISENIKGSKRVMIHQDLFLSLMIWLYAKYELQITQLINKVVKSIDVAVFERIESKALSRPMTDQVKVLQQMLSNEKSGAAATYYATVNRQVRKAAGIPKDTELDAATDAQNFKVRDIRQAVEESITAMIQEGKLTGREMKFAVTNLINNSEW